MATPDSLRYVEGELNYLVPMPERPRYYAYDAGPEAPPTNMAHEAHTVRIRDMRPISSEVALDRQGFALVEQRTAVRDFWDEDEVRRVYYPEAERFIAEVTGASRVVIFDHLQRRRVPGAARRTPGVPPQPATRVHVDHTAKSGPQRVRDRCLTTPRNCCAAASRSSICGVRSMVRCRTPRSRCAMPGRSIPQTSYPRIWSIATGSARPIRSPTTRRTAGTMCRRCGATKRCCSSAATPRPTGGRVSWRTPRSPTRRPPPMLGRARASSCGHWSSTRTETCRAPAQP